MAINSRLARWLMLVTLLAASLAAWPEGVAVAQGGQPEGCGDPTRATLWAGQHTNSGSVTVWNDETNLYAQFQTTGGWRLTDTHVHVATSLNGIPTNDQGIPVPGQFDYATTHNSISAYTYVIPLAWPESTDLIIAAHATVTLLDSAGNATQTETAWGGDQPGGGPRWWFYLEYTTQTCEDEEQVPDGGGCTPGYWRNHSDDWLPTGYQSSQSVGSVFGAAPSELSGDSLLEAVQYQTRSRGPDSLLGAARTLLRAGVAALLNAAHPNVDYPRSAGAVITAVNAALASGDRRMTLMVAETLDDDNNLGCALSGPNTRPSDTGKPDNPGNRGQGNGNPDNPGNQDKSGGKPDNPGNQDKAGGKPDNPGQGRGKKK